MTALEHIGVSQDIIDLTALDKIDKMGLYLKVAISTKIGIMEILKIMVKVIFFQDLILGSVTLLISTEMGQYMVNLRELSKRES